MDFQSLINAALAMAGGALGWFARTLYQAIRSLEVDFANHKVEVAKTHATKHDLGLIDSKLDRMNDKLDRLIERQQ